MPPAVVSVGVNSSETLLRFKLFNKDTCLVILVSVTLLCQNFQAKLHLVSFSFSLSKLNKSR